MEQMEPLSSYAKFSGKSGLIQERYDWVRIFCSKILEIPTPYIVHQKMSIHQTVCFKLLRIRSISDKETPHIEINSLYSFDSLLYKLSNHLIRIDLRSKRQSLMGRLETFRSPGAI